METQSQKAKKQYELLTGAHPSSSTPASEIAPLQPKQEYSQIPAPSGGPGPPSAVVLDELAPAADEKLLSEFDATCEWELSASCNSAKGDMGSTSGNLSSHINSPTVSGGKFRNSGRAQSFLEEITSYFEVFSILESRD